MLKQFESGDVVYRTKVISGLLGLLQHWPRLCASLWGRQLVQAANRMLLISRSVSGAPQKNIELLLDIAYILEVDLLLK